MPQPLQLEIPIFGPRSASAAAANGASRIELNRTGSYTSGGLTPSLAELATVRKVVGPVPPIRVMIRPRGPPLEATAEPDFVYSAAECDEMRRSIEAFRKSGMLDAVAGDGFVFGILRPDGHQLAVDEERNTELVKLAGPFRCVFHRAFDDALPGGDRTDGTAGRSQQEAQDRRVADLLGAVLRCGFDGVLTSGGPGNAPDNAWTLDSIVRHAGEQGVEVVVGGGVRSGNVADLAGQIERGGSRAVWFHSSCLTGSRVQSEDAHAEEIRKIVRELCGLVNNEC